jgi:transcriptional regulator with XRE-family HTH domain
MQNSIQSISVKQALLAQGWTQVELAQKLGVSTQRVSSWLTGKHSPRPAQLLKLAMTLKLGFDQLVTPNSNPPIIAFRRKAGSPTTAEHIAKANAMAAMLTQLVPFVSHRRALHQSFPHATTEYSPLQNAVAQVRESLGLGLSAVLNYNHLTKAFKENDALLIPVLWGEKQKHQNALHILLPEQKITFVYLNLDTYTEDFKFWMAHELAHVFTPSLAGTEAGEDFADAFAGALLFPQACAQLAYAQAIKERSASKAIGILLAEAQKHAVSLFTVYLQTQAFARAQSLPLLPITEVSIHQTRNVHRGELLSVKLFNPLPPKPAQLINAAEHVFDSDFFKALKQIIATQATGVGYIQQVLDISLSDATAIAQYLTGESVN